MTRFEETLSLHGLTVSRRPIETWQMNITRVCNQACHHCHVEASPKRTESMDDRTMDACLTWIASLTSIRVVDITGGAPELHPRFDFLVERVRALKRRVIVRHNLTVTLDKLPHLPHFFASHDVEIVASLPCYQPENTDKQRGNHVFEKSIESLRRLNAVGYGTILTLNLLYNPVGAHLPPSQAALEADYKRELHANYGITFNRLYTVTNQPIGRFRDQLARTGALEKYQRKLEDAFNPQTADGVMCRTLLSIGYDGRIYDCDFNQMLDRPIGSVFDTTLPDIGIRFDNHCFACTAGAGST